MIIDDRSRDFSLVPKEGPDPEGSMHIYINNAYSSLVCGEEKRKQCLYFVEFDAFCKQKKQHFNSLFLLQLSTLGKSINFTNSINLTSFKCRFYVVFVENQDDLNLITNLDTCYIPSQTQGKLIC